MEKIRKKHLSSSQIIIFGFACAILLGTALLMMPFSSQNRTFTPFMDALFTAVSAVCVTGLVVVDTATHWSSVGQAIILLLIQIGGLGIVTLFLAFFMLSGKKIGLMQRSTMQEAISAHKLGGIVKLTLFILITTFSIELIGAIILSFVFCPEFGAKGVWYSLFHSVSAFCNAGFDLMGVKEQFSSLTSYSTNITVNVVIMFLIIFGGIGFLVWDDLRINKFAFRKYRMQTKVVLTTTILLIVLPALYFFIFDFNSMQPKERILASLFHSVTTRTAGFNSTAISSLSGGGNAVTIVLMLIGGSPGSTAGGMKTTTLAVIIFSAISVFRKKDDVECFGRRLPHTVIKNASAVFLMYVMLFFVSSIVISQTENLPLYQCMFESASAIGTVGLSYGITPSLGTVSRLILIALMFFGRAGGLTIIFATFSSSSSGNIAKKPEERITVG